MINSNNHSLIFLSAMKNDIAREFTLRTMIEHYTEAVMYHHPQSKILSKEIIFKKTFNLLNHIFNEIVDLDKNSQNLSDRLLSLGRKHPQRISEWFVEFDEAYDHYKKISKLPFIGGFLLPNLKESDSILDFGCGDGEIVSYLAEELGLQKFSGVDVLDWRSQKNKDNHNFIFYENDFSKETGLMKIPSHHSGLMHAMLHHVSNEPKTIIEYLKNAKNVISDQLLVVEDVLYDKNTSYAGLPGIESLDWAKSSQPNFSKYLELEVKDQLDVITILDLLSNSLAMGIPEMNFPFGAQELSIWLSIFEESGLKLKKIQVLGFQDHLFHRMSQVLFVLEV